MSVRLFEPVITCARAHPEGLVYVCVDGYPQPKETPCYAEGLAMKACAVVQ